MISTIVAIAIALAILMIWPLRNRYAYLLAFLILCYSFYGTVIVFWGKTEREGIVDIANGAPSLTTFSFAVLIAGVLSLSSARASEWFPWVAVSAVALATGSLLFWPRTDSVVSGVLTLSLCLLAWVLGHIIGKHLYDDAETMRVAITLLALFLATQCAVVAYQLAVGQTDNGRATGTFDHPAYLGKLVLLLLIVLLPASQSSDKRTARRASIAVALGVVATATTLSRANILAVLGAVVLWSLATRFSSDRSSRRTIVVAILAVAVSIPLANAFLSRFSTDAEGGDRPELLEAGLRAVSENLWTGLGPNNFVEVRRTIDPIVAQTGYPVHNSMILAIAEMGIVLAVLFFVPLLRSLALAAKTRKSGTAEQRRSARGLIVVMTMVVFAGWTGWGFFQAPTIMLLFLLVGYVAGQIAPKGEPMSDESSMIAGSRLRGPRS